MSIVHCPVATCGLTGKQRVLLSLCGFSVFWLKAILYECMLNTVCGYGQYSIHTLTVAGERKNCSRCNKIQPSCNNSPFFVKYSWSIIYRPLFWGCALSIYKKNILKDCLCHSPNLIFFSCNTKKFQRQFNINKGGKEEQFINLFFCSP